MSFDKHTLQQWVAGAELRVTKSRKPLAGIPLVNRVGRLADHTQEFLFTEKIDLTRARDFHAQQAAEDMLVASVDLPLLGKQGVGNDVGIAVASFKYRDRDGDEHNLIAVCAYTVSGVVKKVRQLKQVIVFPMT